MYTLTQIRLSFLILCDLFSLKLLNNFMREIPEGIGRLAQNMIQHVKLRWNRKLCSHLMFFVSFQNLQFVENIPDRVDRYITAQVWTFCKHTAGCNQIRAGKLLPFFEFFKNNRIKITCNPWILKE